MAQQQVTKIYELRTLGFADIDKDLKAVKKDFEDIAKAKLAAGKASMDAAKNQGIESQAYKDAQKALEEQKVALLQNQAEKKRLQAESVALANATKAESNSLKEATSTTNAAADSYTKLYRSYRELYNLTKNAGAGSTIQFQGNTYGYDAAIVKLKELSAAEQNWRRQFSRDNLLVGEYSSGIVQAFKKMGLDDLIGGQISKTKSKLKDLDTEFNRLKQDLSEVKVTGQGSLEKIESLMIQNRKEAQQLTTQVGVLENEFKKGSDIGATVTQSIANGFKDAKKQVAQFLLGYVGFQAILAGANKLIHGNAELSDSLADLEIRLHGDKQAADEVFQSLLKLDTRTSIGNLIDTASIVAKKGVAKEEIAGITDALDKYFIVAGKEAGNREEGTASIVKLISIFHDDKHVTKERVEEISAALIGLQNSGVATGEKMISFAERIGSIRGITGITLPNVLGLGAALEQLGQRSEVAATAGMQMLTKIFADVPKYAKMAKVPIDEFRQELKDNPFEALTKLSEQLKGGGEDFEKAAQDFEDAGVRRAGLKAVLGDIASNADFVRKRMKDASLAMSDNAMVTKDAAIKNETFAATLNKISNQFTSAASNPSFIKLLNTIAGSILFLIKAITSIPFAVVITGLSLGAAAWAYYKGNVITATIAQQWNNKETLLGIVRNVAARLGLLGAAEASRAKAAALAAETVATEEATIATQELNAATKASPLGIILGILALLVPMMSAFGQSTKKTHSEVAALNDINRQANNTIAEQKAKLDSLMVVVKDNNISLDTRKKALQELSTIDQRFNGILLDQKDALDKLNKAYGDVITSIQLKAKVEATSQLSAEKQKNVLQYTTIRQRVEAEYSRQGKNKSGVVDIPDFTDEEKKTLLGGFFGNELSNKSTIRESGDGVSFWSGDIGKIVSFLKKKEDDATKVYLDYVNINKKKQEELDKFEHKDGNNTGNDTGTSQGTQDIASLKAQLASIDKQIAALDKISNKNREQTEQLKALRKQRTEIKKQIKELGGSTTEPKDTGSHLSGEQRDQFKEIDAARNKELEDAKTAFLEKKKLNQDTIEEQIKYYQQIANIENKYDNKKANSLTGNNPTEYFDRAKLRNGITERNIDTADKIKSLYKKGFDESSKTENDSYETKKSDLESKQQDAVSNINLSETEKANIIIASHAEIQALTTAHFEKLKELANKYQDDAVAIDKQAAKSKKDTEKQNYDDLKKIVESGYADIENTSKKIEDNTRNKYATLANNILANASLTDKQKEKKLEKNEEELSHQLLVIAAAKAKALLDATKKNFDNGNTTQSELDSANSNYSQSVNALGVNEHDKYTKDKAKDFQEIGGAQNYIQNKGAKLFGINQDSDTYKVWAKTVSDAFQTGQNAMNNYFDLEQQRIQNSLKLQERQIDAQKRVALGKAQSSAEQDTIERQFEAKKLSAEKAAFEQNKKMQIAQAKINLAMQLSNLAVVAFAPNPLNIATLGAAGTIMYAVQAALAFANYAMNVSKISAAQFASGGKAGSTSSVPVLGPGPINNPSNIPTLPNGDHILATVKKGEVILNEHQQNMLGGDALFKAIGVPGFAGGGLASSNLSSLASQYPAPIWMPSNNNNGFDKNAFNELKDTMLGAMESVNSRIDRFEVVQVTSSVTKAQKKEIQQQSIGRL